MLGLWLTVELWLFIVAVVAIILNSLMKNKRHKNVATAVTSLSSKKDEVEVDDLVTILRKAKDSLDLRHQIELTGLTNDMSTTLHKVQTLKVFIPAGGFDFTLLVAEKPNVTKLVLTGSPLTRDTLETIKKYQDSTKNLVEFDLSACRTVVDYNHLSNTLCRAEDIFEFQRQVFIPKLVIPRTCEIQIGEAVKAFPQVQVMVVFLERSMAVGDIVEFRRTRHEFSADMISTTTDEHTWTSAQTKVSSIRTDDHTQLNVAQPIKGAKKSNVDSQFAISVTEIAKKGDALFWVGFQKNA